MYMKIKLYEIHIYSIFFRFRMFVSNFYHLFIVKNNFKIFVNLILAVSDSHVNILLSVVIYGKEERTQESVYTVC